MNIKYMMSKTRIDAPYVAVGTTEDGKKVALTPFCASMYDCQKSLASKIQDAKQTCLGCGRKTRSRVLCRACREDMGI